MSGTDLDSNKSRDRAFARPGGFLTAEWRHIAILNYPADSALLAPIVPKGVELDLWNGQAFVSVVGLLIGEVKLLGIRLPFYREFEQVNLRFYVRRRVRESWHPGVVFIREFTPRKTLAAAARLFYNQNFEFARMRHQFRTELSEREVNPFGSLSDEQVPATTELRSQHAGCLSDQQLRSTTVEYCWRRSGRWNCVGVRTAGPPETPQIGSFTEFITRRHWGYASAGRNRTLQFEVARPAWLVSVARGWLDCDAAKVYGKVFADILPAEPASAFLAEGSPVRLGPRLKIPVL